VVCVGRVCGGVVVVVWAVGRMASRTGITNLNEPGGKWRLQRWNAEPDGAGVKVMQNQVICVWW